MTSRVHLLPEHDSACERARLSTCYCRCHGAGHQHDLIVRAVSCTTTGTNTLAELERSLVEIYGGFHSDSRDGATPTRRKVPDDLQSLSLNRGRGATWIETLLLDEALHACFLELARESPRLSDRERAARRALVVVLAEGALRAIRGDLDSHNICDGHVWCSVLAEVNALYRASNTTGSISPSHFGRVCYPRSRSARTPVRLSQLRLEATNLVLSTLRGPDLPPRWSYIVHLMGAASCPDLWHHPAAVRFSLLPLVDQPSFPPPQTTQLASRASLGQLVDRWSARGNW